MYTCFIMIHRLHPSLTPKMSCFDLTHGHYNSRQLTVIITQGMNHFINTINQRSAL